MKILILILACFACGCHASEKQLTVPIILDGKRYDLIAKPGDERQAVGIVPAIKIITRTNQITEPPWDYGRSNIPFMTQGRSLWFGANTEKESLSGRFWTEWRLETNDAPRVCMEKFERDPSEPITNRASFIVLTNGFIQWGRCERDHLDTSEHEEIKYVSSNLLAFIVWRGRTNSNYLESIPVTNIVRKWHEEKRRVYTQ